MQCKRLWYHSTSQPSPFQSDELFSQNDSEAPLGSYANINMNLENRWIIVLFLSLRIKVLLNSLSMEKNYFEGDESCELTNESNDNFGKIGALFDSQLSTSIFKLNRQNLYLLLPLASLTIEPDHRTCLQKCRNAHHNTKHMFN